MSVKSSVCVYVYQYFWCCCSRELITVEWKQWQSWCPTYRTLVISAPCLPVLTLYIYCPVSSSPFVSACVVLLAFMPRWPGFPDFLSVLPFLCLCILAVCKCKIVKTVWDNFTKFTVLVHLGTNVNWWDFGVERSKVKLMVRPYVVKRAEPYASTALCRVSTLWFLMMLIFLAVFTVVNLIDNLFLEL